MAGRADSPLRGLVVAVTREDGGSLARLLRERRQVIVHKHQVAKKRPKRKVSP